MPVTALIMAAMRFLLLVMFLIACAASTTLLLYSITQNPWLGCFVLAATNTLFVLENCALIDEAKKKDQEMEVLRSTHSDVLVKKFKALQFEVDHLHRVGENQRLIITQLKMARRRSQSVEF